MDRRTALKLMAALSATSLVPTSNAATGLRVTVIGAGIVGAASAYFLSKAGAKVTVIDQLGPATHASRGTFAWLNATWAKQPQSYHHFNQLGLAVWKEIQQQLHLPIRWQGSLEWFSSAERNTKLAMQIEEQQLWGEPAKILDVNAIQQLEPNLKLSSDLSVAYSPNDGAVDPVLATQMLLSAAQQAGAKLRFPEQAIGPVFDGKRLSVVKTNQGDIATDKVVIATGADPDTPQLFSGIDIPQRTTPGVITLTKPLPPIVNGIVAAPGVHLHQRDDGRVVLGEQEGPPDGTAHEIRLQGRPNDFPIQALAVDHGERILATAIEYFPALKDAEIETSYIGWRPLPLDGHPVLGSNPERPDVYLAIMHSGVCLAPLVAKLMTKELISQQSLTELQDYRPTRTFSQVVRY